MFSRTALIVLLAAPVGALPAFAQDAPSPGLNDLTSISSLQALKARQFEPGTQDYNQLGFATPRPAQWPPKTKAPHHAMRGLFAFDVPPYLRVMRPSTTGL